MYFLDHRASFSSIHFEAASRNFLGRFATGIPLTADSIHLLRSRSALIARSFLLVLVVSRIRMPRTANSIQSPPSPLWIWISSIPIFEGNILSRAVSMALILSLIARAVVLGEAPVSKAIWANVWRDLYLSTKNVIRASVALWPDEIPGKIGVLVLPQSLQSARGTMIKSCVRFAPTGTWETMRLYAECFFNLPEPHPGHVLTRASGVTAIRHVSFWRRHADGSSRYH